MEEKRLVFVPSQGKGLPYYMESIGFNPDQEPFKRPIGYPFYHWLQTKKGTGYFTIQGERILLKENSGILLSPNVPHSYQADRNPWETIYFTFSGKMVEQLFTHLQIPAYAYFEWNHENILSNHLTELFYKLEATDDLFGVQASTEVYHFIMLLIKYGNRHHTADFSINLEKIQPLLKWLENNIADQNLGLSQMAEFFEVSPRQLNTIFQKTFEVSPYAYFLHMRIKVAKQLLLENKTITVKQISEQVGFRSPSHFIATFRRIVGFSPDQFRDLH